MLQSVTAKGYDNSKKQFRVVGGSAILAGVLHGRRTQNITAVFP